ncbi:unnamed protein product [Closterium sp. NIES-53]
MRMRAVERWEVGGVRDDRRAACESAGRERERERERERARERERERKRERERERETEWERGRMRTRGEVKSTSMPSRPYTLNRPSLPSSHPVEGVDRGWGKRETGKGKAGTADGGKGKSKKGERGRGKGGGGMTVGERGMSFSSSVDASAPTRGAVTGSGKHWEATDSNSDSSGKWWEAMAADGKQWREMARIKHPPSAPLTVIYLLGSAPPDCFSSSVLPRPLFSQIPHPFPSLPFPSLQFPSLPSPLPMPLQLTVRNPFPFPTALFPTPAFPRPPPSAPGLHFPSQTSQRAHLMPVAVPRGHGEQSLQRVEGEVRRRARHAVMHGHARLQLRRLQRAGRHGQGGSLDIAGERSETGSREGRARE